MERSSSRSYLPQHLLEEILKRLSVKSILHFKCLNKSWFTLFQDPTFIAKHNFCSQSQNNNPTFLLKRRDDITKKIVMSLHPNNPDSDSGVELLNLTDMLYFEKFRYLDILGGSCINGIICLYESWYDDSFPTVLWNPAIKEFKVLPTRPVHCPSHVQRSIDGLGFGYDHKSHDYKVVRIVTFWDVRPYSDSNGPYCPPLVEVYTLSTDSWRQTEAGLDASVKAIYCRSQFYLNGAYHWHGSIHDRPYDVIVSFDMTAEIFQIIRLPNLEDNDNASESKVFWPEFSVFHNCIAMIIYDLKQTVTEKIFEIWVMHEYGVEESWNKQFVIGPLLGIQFPLGFAKNDELLLVDSSRQLVSYNSNAQEIKSLQVRGLLQAPQAIVYNESLVSIMGGNVYEN